MKQISLIIIIMLLCSEVYATGCATGYACSLDDLKKRENIASQKEQDTNKQIKSKTTHYDFEQKNKKKIEYNELFKFHNAIY